MSKMLQRLVSELCILALFSCFLFYPNTAHANIDTSKTTTTPSSVTSYVFITKEGDSLSRIARRALQLRSVSDQAVAMYCENSIATQLGGEYIEIGQQVSVTFAQIDDCAASAKRLTAPELANWKVYAETVSFEMNDLNPINNSSEVVAPQSDVKSLDNPSAEITEPLAADSNKTEATATEQVQPSNYWWFIGAAVLVLVYFILDGPWPRINRR